VDPCHEPALCLSFVESPQISRRTSRIWRVTIAWNTAAAFSQQLELRFAGHATAPPSTLLTPIRAGKHAEQLPPSRPLSPCRGSSSTATHVTMSHQSGIEASDEVMKAFGAVQNNEGVRAIKVVIVDGEKLMPLTSPHPPLTPMFPRECCCCSSSQARACNTFLPPTYSQALDTLCWLFLLVADPPHPMYAIIDTTPTLARHDSDHHRHDSRVPPFAHPPTEALQVAETIPASGDWQEDWDETLLPHLEEEVPCFVLYRMDTKGSQGYNFTFISWSPDYAHIRQKML